MPVRTRSQRNAASKGKSPLPNGSDASPKKKRRSSRKPKPIAEEEQRDAADTEQATIDSIQLDADPSAEINQRLLNDTPNTLSEMIAEINQRLLNDTPNTLSTPVGTKYYPDRRIWSPDIPDYKKNYTQRNERASFWLLVTICLILIIGVYCAFEEKIDEKVIYGYNVMKDGISTTQTKIVSYFKKSTPTNEETPTDDTPTEDTPTDETTTDADDTEVTKTTTTDEEPKNDL
eukprot:CAMPEP_0114677428 /NCGR_PEP_ID=MMETSP0191-20121206/50508_1 /TAXON_ID=126664 /ORGANISM="Sorites sp." /LENGTH=231 /DNA_ID=CAMNT_0001949981 /DNA_START=43 /DNA_END=738 /DNA_ORIENTATION=-